MRSWSRGVDGARLVRPAWVAGAVVLVAAVLWWQWPALHADTSRTDVVVVDDGWLRANPQPTERRMRETGDSFAWATATDGWCGLAERVRTLRAVRPEAIVVSVAPVQGCTADTVDAVRRAAGDARLILVRRPGEAGDPAADSPSGVTVADPSALLGAVPAGAAVEVACLWWDTCPAGGRIAVRNADGSLTEAGAERVARLVAGLLP